MSFSSLMPALAQALEARGYEALTPVQLAVLERDARGRDLLVSARTGSGKTVAYGLALAETLMAGGVLPAAGAPLALVVAPTRELAIQVQRELQWLYAGAVVASCVGGMDPRAERRLLERGCLIVVGTPGRLRDHLERGALDLSKLGAVILDEADEMLDMGFREELEAILDATPTSRRTLLFSATLPKPIVALAGAYQKDALRLVVGAAGQGHADIDYRAVSVSPNEIDLAIVNILRFVDPGAALIFCGTREAVRKLHSNLVERGFNVVALSGELTQNERTHALQSLRDGRARICVATDVAARGIDIPDLDLVIHADLPANHEVLQHRSGRTGRAGRKGVCVIVAPHHRRRRVEMLLRSAGINATFEPPPTAEAILARDQARMIEAVTPALDEDLAAARALLAERSAEDVAAAYLRLARARAPAPEDLSTSEPEPPRSYGSRGEGPRGDAPRAEPPRAGFEDAAWFRIDLGRSRNAEARWILPMLCRRGHLTKGDIGAIRVFERDTRFQIRADAVARFEAAVARGDSDGGRITRLADGGEPSRAPRPDRPPRAAHPTRDQHPPREPRPPGDWSPLDPKPPRNPAKPPKAKKSKGKPNG